MLCGVALCILMTVQSILQKQQLLTSRNSEHADIMTRLSLEASSLLKIRFLPLLCVRCVNTLRNVMAVISESFFCKYKCSAIKDFQF